MAHHAFRVIKCSKYVYVSDDPSTASFYWEIRCALRRYSNIQFIFGSTLGSSSLNPHGPSQGSVLRYIKEVRAQFVGGPVSGLYCVR